MIEFKIPKVYQQFRDNWQRQKEALLGAYEQGRLSFVPNLLPEQALQMTAEETLGILRRRLGAALDDALAHTDPARGESSMPAPALLGSRVEAASIRSPVAGQSDGNWLKTSKMVGVNVRTTGSFWNVVKYALTIPRSQGAIHLLPIWEPGVVGSLYGISSWRINDEFYSEEMAEACPGLDTAEKQLKAVINLLHAMGKAVGMDVIPHTDRFSEIALAQPQYFEWLQREDTEIVDHSEDMHQEVQACIMDFLATEGPAVQGDSIPASREAFFAESFPEERRLLILFGLPEDRRGRSRRRNALVKHLYAYGYEPVPATMAPPYRGLEIDPQTAYIDSQGSRWYEYVITRPQGMSRVFGPLARFKLYGRMDDNANWEIDFDRPRPEVWRYICEKYYDVQHRYGFDFMRGDMSHVQMRPRGVPEAVDDYYDILRAVKAYIQREKGVRHFGYFAETFLAARGIMVYGDEVDHLEASDADTTLGDLQSTRVGSKEFLQRLRQYYDLLETRSFAPNFAVMTGDKDDPRFDEFYVRGCPLRLFIALFLADMPSYMGLGFESRDVHYKPAPNEHYTKLYVFQEMGGLKATAGPYVWGRNGALFATLTRIRLYAEGIWPAIEGRTTRWLIPPDATAQNRHIAWTQRDGRPDYVFVANTDTEQAIENFNIPRIPALDERARLAYEFSTDGEVPEIDQVLDLRGKGYKVMHLAAGEGRVYHVARGGSA